MLTATGYGGSSMSLKALRLFRVLRPLRLVAKFERLKLVIGTLLQSFRTLFHVSMFIGLLVLLYAITGMELFAGEIASTYTFTALNHFYFFLLNQRRLHEDDNVFFLGIFISNRYFTLTSWHSTHGACFFSLFVLY